MNRTSTMAMGALAAALLLAPARGFAQSEASAPVVVDTAIAAGSSDSLRQDIEAIEQLSALGDDARDVGLAGSVRTALRENLGLQVRLKQLEAATSRLKASWAPWMPYLVASGNLRPSRSERWFDQYKSWERTRGDQGNYAVGVGAALFTGTSLNINWAQGSFNQFTEYDPEVRIENPLDPDNPIDVLVNNEFHTRWSSLSLELNQNLLQGISPEYQLQGVRQAKISLDAADIEQTRQISQVVGDVMQAYWDLVASRRLVEIQRIDRRLAEEQRTVTQARIAAGDMAPIELFRIDETVATASAGLLEAERSAAEAEQRLKLLLGVGPDDALFSAPLRPIDGVATVLPTRDGERSMQVALTKNPDLLLQRGQLESRRIQWRSARHEVLPTLDLRASLALNGAGFDVQESVEDVFSSAFPDFELGVNFRMPIPDIGAIRGLEAADLEVEAALITLQEAERAVLAGVQTALRSVESFEKQVEVAVVRVRLAERSAEAAEATYSAGRNTLRDVLEAQAGLKEARQAEVQAQVQALKSRVELELLRGSLLDALGVELQ